MTPAERLSRKLAYYHAHKDIIAVRAAQRRSTPEARAASKANWQRWWTEHREDKIEKTRLWNYAHPERVKARNAVYRQRHPGRSVEAQRLARLVWGHASLRSRLRFYRVPRHLRAALLDKLLPLSKCCYCGNEVSWIRAEVLIGLKRQAQLEHLNGRKGQQTIDDFDVACADCNFAHNQCESKEEKLASIAEARWYYEAGKTSLWGRTRRTDLLPPVARL